MDTPDHEPIKRRIKQKLQKERLIQPRGVKDTSHGLPDSYKIKITRPEYRLAYQVHGKAHWATILGASTRDDEVSLLQGDVQPEPSRSDPRHEDQGRALTPAHPPHAPARKLLHTPSSLTSRCGQMPIAWQ